MFIIPGRTIQFCLDPQNNAFVLSFALIINSAGPENN